MISPDLALINAKIYSLNNSDEVFQAVAILGGKILAVGTDSEIKQLCGKSTRVIDLKQKVGIPGFSDTHVHAASAGIFASYYIDCSKMKSVEEIIEAVKTKASDLEPGRWILGNGYDEFKMIDARAPTKLELDGASPNNPCVIWRRDLHVLSANSLALKIARISRETKDPEGGKILRTEDGEPTGVLAETAQNLVSEHIPAPTNEELKKAILVAQDRLAEWGVTSYDEALTTREEFGAYQELRREGKLKLRTGLILAANFAEEPIAQDALRAGIKTGLGDDVLRIEGAKIITDGSLASYTAAMLEPYPGRETTGTMILSEEQLESIIVQCVRGGLRPCIHAIGDRALTTVVGILEKVIKQENIPSDHRIRIEHCGFVSEDMLDEIKSNHILVSSSTTFVYKLGDSHLRVLGLDRMKNYYPGKSYVERGIVVSGNSDWPVTPANPMIGIYSLVTRKTEQGKPIWDNEKINLREAIRFYTKSAAFLDYQEDLRGTIGVGKLADLVFFDEDIFGINVEQLLDVSVYMTIVDGKIVYSAE